MGAAPKICAAPQDQSTPRDGYTLRNKGSSQNWMQTPKMGVPQDLGTPLRDTHTALEGRWVPGKWVQPPKISAPPGNDGNSPGNDGGNTGNQPHCSMSRTEE